MADERAVEALDQCLERGVRAVRARSTGDILAEDFVAVTADGQTVTKAQLISHRRRPGRSPSESPGEGAALWVLLQTLVALGENQSWPMMGQSMLQGYSISMHIRIRSPSMITSQQSSTVQ